MCWGWERMHGVTWMSWQKKSSTHNYFLYQDTFSKIKQSLDSTCRRSSACVSIFKGIWFHCTVHYFTCMYDRSIIHRKSGLKLHKASNCLQTSPAISSLTSSKNRPKLWKKKKHLDSKNLKQTYCLTNNLYFHILHEYINNPQTNYLWKRCTLNPF